MNIATKALNGPAPTRKQQLVLRIARLDGCSDGVMSMRCFREQI